MAFFKRSSVYDKVGFSISGKIGFTKRKTCMYGIHMYIFLGQLVSHVRKHKCIFISLCVPKYIPGDAEI